MALFGSRAAAPCSVWTAWRRPDTSLRPPRWSPAATGAPCDRGVPTVVLCHWVHGRWQHDGGNEPTHSDPVSILREAEEGKRFRCAEYAGVLAGVCTAIGIPARALGCMTADCETREVGASHVVTEAFLPDRRQWAFADAQCDVVAGRAGEPLNAAELQAVAAQPDGRFEVGALSEEDAAAYAAGILPYLHYLSAPLDNRVGVAERSHRRLVLVPPGSPRPRVFQRKYPLHHCDFTRSLRAFYPLPQ